MCFENTKLNATEAARYIYAILYMMILKKENDNTSPRIQDLKAANEEEIVILQATIAQTKDHVLLRQTLAMVK